jgi:MATE family multidrug resistance protein
VLFIAWPIILSNLSTPLLGLVDTAVIGNLGDPALIGAIAVGAMIFSFIFWGFGFLRMGTTGLVAQANGAGDVDEVKATFYRATILAAMIAFMLLLLQKPLAIIAFSLIEGSDAVESAALTYFTIRIWGAPFSLLHLAVLGYLLGQGKSTLILWLQLLLNGTNIVLDVVFVVFLGWDVAGIAAATLIAEILAATFGLFLVLRHMRTAYGSSGVRWEQLKDIPALVRMLNVNRDIMIRTLCLIFAFAWFTNEGAKAGDVLLASNAILMQFVSFSAFFLDGYALAAESLVGVAVGARNEEQYSLTLRYICELGFANSLLLSGAFFFGGPFVIDLLTNVPEVREASRVYLVWAIAAPVVSLWCYLLDGVFIGATCTKEMRNAMIISLLAFLAGWYLLQGPFGNHGLWLSLQLYFIARALSLAWYLPNVRTQTMS